MKSTLLTTKCLSAARRIARSGKTGALERAHMPLRRRTAVAWAAPVAREPAIPARPAPVADNGLPRVLHVDTETGTAAVLASLLGGGVHVTHVVTLAEARRLLLDQIFSLVVLDPRLPDGDAATLLPLLAGTSLLIYSDLQPPWRDPLPPLFLSKSWTTARQLWTAMAPMLWNTSALSAGD